VASDNFKIIFAGKIDDDKKREKLGILLCKFLKIPPEKWEKLFDGRSYSIFKGLSEDKANEIHGKLKNHGVITKIIVEKQVVQEVTQQEETKHSKLAEQQSSIEVVPEIQQNNSQSAQNESKANNYNIQPRWNDTVSQLAELDMSLPESKQRSSLELYSECHRQKRSALAFSVPALLFGIFYYFYLGLFKRGFLLLGVSSLLVALIHSILILSGLEAKPVHTLLISNILFCAFAKVDFYQVKIRHNGVYKTFHAIENSWLVALFTIASMWLSILAQFGVEQLHREVTQSTYLPSSLTQPNAETPIAAARGYQPNNSEETNSKIDQAYFKSPESLERYSKKKYGTKNGVIIHAVN
jgi:hypothetical protein